MLPFERAIGVFDGDAIVAGAGAFPFELSIPGGALPCAGVTVVGVHPTHRRQGILGRMMRAQLAEVRERGEPIAALWASEETIYGRYGYGLAAQDAMIRASRVHAAMHPGLPGRVGTTRLVGHDEALKVFPRIYDRVRRTTPGFISRSKAWWELRKLDDRPERRRGGGELNRVLLEIDGRAGGLCPLPDQGRVRGRHQQEPRRGRRGDRRLSGRGARALALPARHRLDGLDPL